MQILIIGQKVGVVRLMEKADVDAVEEPLCDGAIVELGLYDVRIEWLGSSGWFDRISTKRRGDHINPLAFRVGDRE